MKTTRSNYITFILGILFLFISFSSISQDLFTEEQLNRKVLRLFNAERDLYRLPFEKTFIRESLVPDVIENRNAMAPHFPNSPSISKEIREERLKEWIVEYYDEYTTFIDYFESFIRSHF